MFGLTKLIAAGRGVDQQQRANLLRKRFDERLGDDETLWAIYEQLARQHRRKGASSSPGYAPGSLCELEMIERCFKGKKPISVHVLTDDWTPYELADPKKLLRPGADSGQSLEIKQQIEAVRGRYNYCLLNRYRSGADSVGLHADNEPGMGNVIGSLSLGATRTFRIRHNRTKETRLFPVGNGTLIIMAGTMQQFWKHEILKTTESVGERINLTFRMIGQV